MRFEWCGVLSALAYHLGKTRIAPGLGAAAANILISISLRVLIILAQDHFIYLHNDKCIVRLVCYFKVSERTLTQLMCKSRGKRLEVIILHSDRIR